MNAVQRPMSWSGERATRDHVPASRRCSEPMEGVEGGALNRPRATIRSGVLEVSVTTMSRTSGSSKAFVLVLVQ